MFLRKSLLLFAMIILPFFLQAQNVENYNENWKLTISSEENQKLYFPGAVKVFDSGDVLTSAENISEHWHANNLSISSIRSTFNIIASDYRKAIYEIGTFNASDGNSYTHLTILNYRDDTIVRELEFIAQTDNSDIDLADIAERRAEWMEYCNAHDAEGLVENLYTENSIYYNHRPLIIGQEALTAEYQYMNNPRYSLRLIPLHVEVVNENLVFEIGQCERSYNGKYMIAWQKNKDGIWQVLMDSNI